MSVCGWLTGRQLDRAHLWQSPSCVLSTMPRRVLPIIPHANGTSHQPISQTTKTHKHTHACTNTWVCSVICMHTHTHTTGCVLSPVTLSCCHYACAHWEQVSLTSKDEGGTPPPCTASTHRHTNIQGPLLTYKSTHTLFCGLMPHFLLH